MRKTYFLSVLSILIVAGFSLNAQTQTNAKKLLDFAAKSKAVSETQKAEAIQFAEDNNLPVRKVLDDGTEMEIMRIKNGKPVYYVTHNADAAITTRTDKLWPGGALGLSLDGSGYTKLGEWDGGAVLTTHQEFTDAGPSRVTQEDGAGTLSDHATHVAGTMVAHGVDADAKGMGYNGSLKAYDWNSDESEMATAAAAGMEVSNHSYGVITGWYWNGASWDWYGNASVDATEDYNFGFYDSQAADWDEIAYDAPNYLIVKSAGNDRGDGPANAGTGGVPELDGGTDGYDCIGHSGVAKNVLTVGAVNPVLSYTGPSSVVMSSFSSWGPADDGRIKPDIVADGVGVYSCSSAGTDQYTEKNGTSMASPNTTGTLALLQKHYQNLNAGTPMRSATLKALIIHTADEAGDAEGPDYKFGWGLLNAERAAQKISEDDADQNVIDELSITDGNSYTRDVTVSGNSPLRVTVVWTDVKGTPVAASLNPTDPMLVNDLDLRISDGSKTTYYPYSLDVSNPSAAASKNSENDVDNVEMVYIAEPTAGTYTITVDHDGTLSGGSQAFSIIISGIDEYTSVPDCVGSMTNPADGATDVGLMPTLSWEEVTSADSYLIYLGTDGGGTSTPTDVLNGMETGLTSYTLTESLDPNTTYYVQIIAKNNQGNASGCSIWSFTTTTAVTSFPHTQNFDGLATPNQPAGWTSVENSGASWVSSSSIFNSASNSMLCFNDAGGGSAYYTDMDNWLFTKPVYMTAGKQYNVSFYQRVYNGGLATESLKIMVGTSQTEAGMTTTLLDEASLTNSSWTERSGLFPVTETGFYYIGFYAYSTGGLGIFVDDLEITETDGVQVTFQVDMQNQTVSGDGVHLAGNFGSDGYPNWDPAGIAMSDGDADDVYTVTLTLTASTDYEFKYINGDEWGEDETVPADCQVPGTANRGYTTTTSDATLDEVCYNECSDCTTGGPTHYIAGDMNTWSPNDASYAMTMNANGLYELTSNEAAGTYEYKLVASGSWYPGNNQSVTIASQSDITWLANSANMVTHRVPTIVGDFFSASGLGNDWDLTNPNGDMTDEGDGTYTWQGLIVPGDREFKVVLNQSYDQSNPASGNTTVTSTALNQVKITYDFVNNTISTTEIIPTTATWTGTDGNDWATAGNWDVNGVPGSTTNVTIPVTGITNFPTVNEARACNNITLVEGATILGFANLTVNGTATITQNLTGGTSGGKDDADAVYHYISSPMASATAGSVFPLTAYVRAYDETTQTWVNKTQTDVLTPGTGYSLWLEAGNAAISYEGQFNTADIPVSGLTVSGAVVDYSGYHFLGNPYPAALNWDAGSWSRSNLDGSVYIYDGAAGNYKSWNGTAGSLGDGIIGVGQGFFVKANAAGASLSIPVDATVHNSKAVYKNEVENLLNIAVRNTQNNTNDETVIHFRSDASASFDNQMDAYKITGSVIAPQLYTFAGESHLSINTRPFTEEMNLNFETGRSGSFVLEIPAFSMNYDVTLEDKLTGETIRLSDQTSYSFTASDNDVAERFILRFKDATSVEDVFAGQMQVYSRDKDIIVDNATGAGAEATLFTVHGQKLGIFTIENGINKIKAPKAAAVYLIQINSGSKTSTQKVFIK